MKKKYIIIYIITTFYGCSSLEKEIIVADISKSQSFHLEAIIKNPNTLQLEIKGEVDSNIQFNHYWLSYNSINRQNPYTSSNIFELPKGKIDTLILSDWYADTLTLYFEPLKAKKGHLTLRYILN